MLQAMVRPAMLEAAVLQDLANTLWAVSELQQHCKWQPQVQQQVWQKLLGERMLKSAADLSRPQAVSNTAWALARLSRAAAPIITGEVAQHCVLQLLQGKVAQQLDKWSAQDVSTLMLACGRLRVFDAGFFDRAAAAAPVWLNGAITINLVQGGICVQSAAV
jgi:hypothetical protein